MPELSRYLIENVRHGRTAVAQGGLSDLTAVVLFPNIYCCRIKYTIPLLFKPLHASHVIGPFLNIPQRDDMIDRNTRDC